MVRSLMGLWAYVSVGGSCEGCCSSFVVDERIVGEPSVDQRKMREIVFEYIEVFYNRKRRHSTLGYQSPIQYLRQWAKNPDPGKLAA